MAARRVPAGGDCIVAAFPDTDTAGLAAAAQAITTSTGSTVGTALTDALDPRHWQQSRSAIGGLRRLGVAALAAAPALAGWVRLCAPVAVTAEEQYTVNEGFLALAELRRLAVTAPEVPPAAVAAVTGFLDTTFEASLTSLLAPPLRIWHRGALGYLRGLHGDPERLLPLLHGFLTALDGPQEADPDAAWHEYTRMELVSVIADLGPRLDRLRVERGWQEAFRPAQPPDRPSGRATDPATPPGLTQPGGASDLAPPDLTPPDRGADLLAEGALDPAAPRDVAPPNLPPPDLAAREVAAQGRTPEAPADLTQWLIGELAVPSIARRRAACAALVTLGPRAAGALPAVLRLLTELDAAPQAVVGELRDQALAAAVAISTPPAWDR
ncbi:hypothetical protein OHA72_54005 [Dactylosporangium sp. NBC_01737]|uniref:hypothetical protein n=1 Tax=Dactylosporangium sp. NBC_01737 TaxID=2975959 RepID=UPI002E100FD3|nr:hypothetical protein OHA72_54005 [Dactylosporangium sp. NBC_01737]